MTPIAEQSNTAQSCPRFGKYEIHGVVGRGGMGVIYQAHDTVLGRDVALKVLRDDLQGRKTLLTRFHREAQAAARLEHKHIVHIFEVGMIEQVPYIAMEFIDGGSLSELIMRDKRIPWKFALNIALQVSGALGKAHEAQIIHRDIKPANILMADGGCAYVTDFGVAKILDAETQLTLDSRRLGTPVYMSPERCHGGELTPSSDLYSLGVVVFQMIAGRSPFIAKDNADLVRKIITETPPRLRTIVPDVPVEVEKLVAYMLEKKPAARPGSAEVLSEAIVRVLNGKSLVKRNDQAAGLAGFRKELTRGTPTPTPTATPTTTTQLGLLRPRVGRKTLLTGLAVVLVIFGVGVFVGLRGSALVEADRSLDRWSASGDAATFMAENEGLYRVNIHLPHFAVLGAQPTGNGGFVLSLDGRARSPRQRQSAAVLLRPDSQTVDILRTPRLGPPLAVDAPFEAVDVRIDLDAGGVRQIFRGATQRSDFANGTEDWLAISTDQRWAVTALASSDAEPAVVLVRLD